MKPVVKYSLTGLAAVYMIGAAHLVVLIQPPHRQAWASLPTIEANAYPVRPEIYALR